MKINDITAVNAEKLCDRDPRTLNRKQKRFLVAINNKFVKTRRIDDDSVTDNTLKPKGE